MAPGRPDFCAEIEDAGRQVWFLICDQDSKFTACFDEVFASIGAEVIRTPVRSPKANALAGRWVRPVREDCLDHLLVVSRRHLEAVLGEYVEHYDRARPHRGLALVPPHRAAVAGNPGKVHHHHHLGGLVHEYDRAA